MSLNNKNRVIVSEVRSIDDPQGGMRIKVRVEPDDASILHDEDLPYCFPLLPKLIHTYPKLGEAVIVFIANDNSRYYIGPVISQEYGLGGEPFYTQARCLLPAKIGTPYTNPKNLANSEGVYPAHDDVAIRGKVNTDIYLKESEIRFLCGHKKNPKAHNAEDRLVFNREDLAFLRMKHKPRVDANKREYSSSIDIVADRINLLSHDSRTVFNLNNPKELITESEEKRVQAEAHPMIYGDDLVDFLKQIIDLIRRHTHPFAMDPPCFSEQDISILNTNLNQLLSTGIKFN